MYYPNLNNEMFMITKISSIENREEAFKVFIVENGISNKIIVITVQYLLVFYILLNIVYFNSGFCWDINENHD